VDTILLGRKTYELFVDYWPTATTDEEIFADRLNERSSARRWSEGGRPLFPTRAGYTNFMRVNVRTYDTGAMFLHYEPKQG
jgi:hypothetical protein